MRRHILELARPPNTTAAVRILPSCQELTVGVGEGPEILEQETPIPSGRGNGNGSRKAKQASAAKRGAKSSSRANSAEDADVSSERRPTRERASSREQSLHRLLAGLRAVNAGDFSVQLAPNGDPLMADIIDVFNSLAHKQARLVDEI